MSITPTPLAEPAEAPLPAPPPASVWLPLTVEDRRAATPEGAPEHNWPASLFIFLTRLTAFGLGLGAVGAVIGTVVMLISGEWGTAGLMALAALGLALGCVVQGTLARSVKNFTRWGWYGAMAELVFLTLSKVNVIVTEPSAMVGALFGIALDLLWMNYFWERRADFDVDLTF